MNRTCNMPAVLAAVLMALLLPGCGEDYHKGGCELVITVLRQDGQEAELTVPEDVVAYGFLDATARSWHVASYDDASAGILTNTETGQKRDNPDFTAVQDGDLRLTFGPVRDDRPVFVVLCDRDSLSYAYREMKTAETLPQIYAELAFRPWRRPAEEGRAYAEFGWFFVNRFIPEPPAPVDPNEPTDPEGPEEPENPERPGGE